MHGQCHLLYAPGVRANRKTYTGLAVVTLVVGYLSRAWSHPGSWVYDDAGDALWAMMVAWLVNAAVGPRRPVARWLAALGICGAVELSQCLDWSWLVAARGNRLGALVLGHAFSVHDLVLYAVGCCLVAGLDAGLRRGR